MSNLLRPDIGMRGAVSNNNKNNSVINVDVNDLEDVVCANCGNNILTQVLRFKKVPITLSKSGKQEIHPLVITICTKCGKQILLDKDLNDSIFDEK